MRLLAAAVFAALLVSVACGGGTVTPTATPALTATPRATATPAPSATSTATPHGSGSGLGLAAFDADRAVAHVEALATGIGPRPAGSDAERKAARYLRDQLQGFDYEVEVQPFSYDVFVDAGSSLNVISPQPLSPAVYPFEPSANGAVEGELVDAGLGAPDDFPAGVGGKVALIERGVLFFADKVANAAAAGAAAAVIYNDRPGLFGGQLSGPSEIPALAISRDDGRALLELMASGPVSVRLEVLTERGPGRSQNVVARPPDGDCRVVAGGHYDSVPAGPGANDNASGTATVVEMARVMAADGEFDDTCFVLFGAEEVGLIGSARFVASLTADEIDALESMLNFDMVGVGTRLLLSGSSASLNDLAEKEADERGLDYLPGSASGDGGSDHASFVAAGIPAIFFHSFFETIADDPAYHTSEDRTEHVQAARMADIGNTGLGLIEALLGGR